MKQQILCLFTIVTAMMLSQHLVVGQGQDFITYSETTSLPDLLRQSELPGYKLQSHALRVRNPIASNGYEFRLYFLGQGKVGSTGSDRILLARSFDGGVSWSLDRTPSLSPSGDIADGKDRADDHLVGSPTIVRLPTGSWYMLYEGYGKWHTALRNVAVNEYPWPNWFEDNWTSNESIESPNGSRDQLIGCAPLFKKEGTEPVYLVKATHWIPYVGYKIDRFITKDPKRRPFFVGFWEVENSGRPVFYAYKNGGKNLVPLKTFWNWYFDTETTVGANSSGAFVEDIGYVIEDISKPTEHGETDFALLNRVMLAKSNDGITWSKIDGNGPGECVLAPARKFAAKMPKTPQGELLRSYGSGVPVMWLRGQYVEVLFTDGSTKPFYAGEAGDTQMWYTRIHMNDIENPRKWEEASARRIRTQIDGAPNVDGNGYGLSDVKWSDRHQRYFAVAPWWRDTSKIALYTSQKSPTPGKAPFFPNSLIGSPFTAKANKLVYDVSLLGEADSTLITFDRPFDGAAFHYFPTLIPQNGSIHDAKFGHLLQFGASNQ